MNPLNARGRLMPFVLPLLSCMTARTGADEELRFPADKTEIVRTGHVAEDSHNTYQVKIAASQKLTIRIASDNRRARFFVSAIKGFTGAQALEFGRFSKDQQSWSARFPDAGDYYVYVTASPESDYTLSLQLK